MKRLLIAASLNVLALSAFALQSIDVVQAKIGKGNDSHARGSGAPRPEQRPNDAGIGGRW